MVRLSKRLAAVASMVSCGSVLADVGTDHGYIPIALLEQGRIPMAIAMDIGRGPLARAREHIAQHGMQEYIETRLSDGVAALAPGEADSIVIAGMGGGLVIHILTAGEAVCRQAGELVLQPQSELERVRAFLREAGYVTASEDMVAEDGKYYPMMRVFCGRAPERAGQEEHVRLWDRYGGMLLEERHPVLREYLRRESGILEGILKNLRGQEKTEQIAVRILEVERDLRQNGEALAYYRTE